MARAPPRFPRGKIRTDYVEDCIAPLRAFLHINQKGLATMKSANVALKFVLLERRPCRKGGDSSENWKRRT